MREKKTTGKACEQDRGCARKVGLIETVIGTHRSLVLCHIEQGCGDWERAGTTRQSLGLSGMVIIEWPSFSPHLTKRETHILNWESSEQDLI